MTISLLASAFDAWSQWKSARDRACAEWERGVLQATAWAAPVDCSSLISFAATPSNNVAGRHTVRCTLRVATKNSYASQQLQTHINLARDEAGFDRMHWEIMVLMAGIAEDSRVLSGAGSKGCSTPQVVAAHPAARATDAHTSQLRWIHLTRRQWKQTNTGGGWGEDERNERRRAAVRKSKDISSGSSQSSAGICLDPAEASRQLPLNGRVSQLRRDDAIRSDVASRKSAKNIQKIRATCDVPDLSEHNWMKSANYKIETQI